LIIKDATVHAIEHRYHQFNLLLTTRFASWNHLYGASKGGEHRLCDILISAGVNTPAAKWLGLLIKNQTFGVKKDLQAI